MLSHRALALAALLWLAPAALAAQQGPTQAAAPALSLEEALGLAVAHNPRLLQQQNDIGVAHSATRSARADLFLPTASASSSLGYSAPGEVRFESQVVGEQPATYFSSYNLGLSYQFSGQTLLQPSVQRSQARATTRRVAGVEAELLASVTRQYLSVLQARAQVEQAGREVERTREHVRLAEARLEVGAGTPLDVRRAEVQKGQAEVSLVQARNQYATAMLSLGQQIGQPLDVGTTLTSEFQIFEPVYSADALVAQALGNNPNLLSARADVDAAATSIRSARSRYLPSMNLSVGMRGYVNEVANLEPLVDQQLNERGFLNCQRNNQIAALIGAPTQPCLDPSDPTARELVRGQLEQANSGFPFAYDNQPWQAAMTVSLPLFTGLDRQLQVDQARAAAADARYQLRAEELRLQQEVATALLTLRAAYETALLQEQVREAAAEELRLAQERFRFGAASSVEVTDAQTNLRQAERDQINAVYTFHQSLAALEALVGRTLR